jgi:predicted dienelactone hydrolase
MRLPFLLLATLLTLARTVGAADYDPLAADTNSVAAPLPLTVHDAVRHRDLPILVYLPVATNPEPVVLFSHGLGGTRENYPFLGWHWAARGFVGVFVQHPGSDDSVWKDLPPKKRLSAMRRAASLDNYLLRIRDISVVLDQLTAWNQTVGHPLAGRVDLAHIGMSGHSFGAATTEAVSGEVLPIKGQKLTDPRIRAAVAFSPSTPVTGHPEKAFGSVPVPWLLMTGTRDLAPIGIADLKSRRAVYANLRGAPKYEVVLDRAEHSAFSDAPLPGDREPRNPNHHRVMLALTTAFWDTYLKNDPAARAWLNSDQPRTILETADSWQFQTK